MTWGQIRFQILQTSPGLNLDILDGWLNARYEQVLEAGDWTGIHARASITTIIGEPVYTLPPDCSSVETIIDPITGYPLIRFTPGELDDSAGLRTQVCNPAYFAEIEPEPEMVNQTPLHQITLFPTPSAVLTYGVEYLRSAFGFDSQNLSQSPLPFVSMSVLLFGVRADIALAAGKLPQAQGYESQFKEELLRLLRVEHAQRRAKPTMRMAARFVRHRLDRVLRGYPRHF